MDKKKPSKKTETLSFSWGGTNPLWENEANIIANEKEKEKQKENQNKTNKNDHFYLRDYN